MSIALKLRSAAFWTLALATAGLGLASTPAARAGAVVGGFNGSTLSANDDSSVGPVDIGFTANFFGNSYSQLYVNNNGNVTFGSSLNTYTPFALNTTNIPIIAPFFGDVDTRGAGSGLVSYGAGTFDGHAAFGVNWPDVGYYGYGIDKLNNFQLLLVDRSDTGAGNFDIVFNYNQIQWEAGSASNGTDGLGGSSARVGYSNGTTNPGTFFELPGSAVNGAFLDSNAATGLIHNSLNSGVAGRYIFADRNGVIVPTVPEPGTLVMSGFATLVGLSIAWRKRARA